MSTKLSVMVLAIILAISGSSSGSKLLSQRYGAYDDQHRGHVYDKPTQQYQNPERQSYTPYRNTSPFDRIGAAIKKIIFRAPSERQAELGGLASAIQGAAVPLAVAGIVAANREQILEAINPSTTATTASTTTVDYCSGVTCTDPYTCDTTSGVCKCGTKGPASCGTGTTAAANLCISGACYCGQTSVPACSGSTPVCLLAAGGGTVGTETGTTVECACLWNAAGPKTAGGNQNSCATNEVCCGKAQNDSPSNLYGTATAAKTMNVCTTAQIILGNTCD